MKVVEMRKEPGADTPRRAKSGGRPNKEAGLPVVVVVVVMMVVVVGDACADTDKCEPCFMLLELEAPEVVLERRASRGLLRIGEDGFCKDCDILPSLLLTRLRFDNNGGGGGGVEEVVPLFQDACGWCCCQAGTGAKVGFSSAMLGSLLLLLLLEKLLPMLMLSLPLTLIELPPLRLLSEASSP